MIENFKMATVETKLLPSVGALVTAQVTGKILSEKGLERQRQGVSTPDYSPGGETQILFYAFKKGLSLTHQSCLRWVH